jgi:hypothetical protein
MGHSSLPTSTHWVGDWMAQEPVWTLTDHRKICCFFRELNTGLPARSPSLYRLSYTAPGHHPEPYETNSHPYIPVRLRFALILSDSIRWVSQLVPFLQDFRRNICKHLSLSIRQYTFRISWNPMSIYFVHNNTSLGTTIRQMDSVHIIYTLHFSGIHFNIIL